MGDAFSKNRSLTPLSPYIWPSPSVHISTEELAVKSQIHRSLAISKIK